MSAHFKNALSGASFSVIGKFGVTVLAAILALSSVVLAMPNISFALPVTTFVSDDFEGAGNLTGWSTTGSAWSEIGPVLFISNHSGTRAARALGDTGAVSDNLTLATSTVGYTNITVKYWYRVTTILNSNDHFYAEYSTDGGSTWTQIQHLGATPIGNWTQVTAPLPAAAQDNPLFQIRFRADFDAPLGLDSVRIDDLSIEGEAIPACVPGASTFDYFNLGSVSTQNGWLATGPFDQAIVKNIFGYATFGCQSLRISNAVTSGSFGDQTFSSSVTNEAGEAVSTNGGMSGGTRQNVFEAEFDVASTMFTQQSGLAVTVSPDRGDGSRMSFIRLVDDVGGIDVFFVDVQGTGNPANFVTTQIANDLSRAVPHKIKFWVGYANGPSNDVVKMYIDGALVHTGTSWENYYRFDSESAGEQTPRTTDSLLFRVSSTAAPANAGKGYVFDNMTMSTLTAPGSIEITKYMCPAGTQVTRAANGVGLTVPAGCVPQTGATFGYVHGAQTDANSPYPELGAPITAGGATNGSGLLTISDLPTDGRYLIVETGGANQQLPANAILGLYCQGDGDQSNTNDNQELTFVTPGSPVKCVAYNPTPAPQIVVKKVIVNTGGGSATFGSFSFKVNGGADVNFDENGFATTTVPAGTYTVVENNAVDYTASYSGCTGTVADGEVKHCTITNTYIVPVLACDAIVDSNTVVQSDASVQVNAGNASVITPHSAWVLIPSVSWIGETAYDANVTTNAVGTTTYTRSFSITGTPLNSTLQISADNGYEVWVNGTMACADADGSNFTSIDTCNIPAGMLQSGSNMLTIEVDNQPAPQDYQGPNPAGLTFKLTVTKNACIPAPVTSTVTMCKVDQNQQPLSGWTVTLKGNSVEDVTVNANDIDGENSIANMLLGMSYIATASGTWNNQSGANPADAEYSSTSTWATHMDGYDGYSTDILELQINSTFDPNSNWGAYNTSHTYAQSFMGMGTPVNFRVYDGTGGVQNPDWFADNSGSLSVNVSEGYAGITGQNGCVSFANVPVGSYTTGEVMQDGWTNISGDDENVTVIGPTDTFTIQNTNGEEPETTDVQMCKVDQNGAPLMGWTLMLLGDEVGAVSVLPTGATFTIPNVPAGSYVVTADGEYVYRSDAIGTHSDAAYSKRNPSDGFSGPFDPWYRVNDFPMPYTGWLGIMLNSSVTDWGNVFNPAHIYAHGTTTSMTSDFNFSILDDQYGDNSGDVSVSVNHGYVGVTGETGCVDFSDVPMGEYLIQEIMQDGWTNTSGLGGVEVDEDNNEFTIVNDNGQGMACDANAMKQITSTAMTSNAVVLSYNHVAWVDETLVDPAAKWVWSEDGVNDPTVAETEVFTDTFTILGTPLSAATLTLAADNTYSVSVNGDPVIGCSSTDLDNFSATDSCSIPVSQLINGVNTISFTVTNQQMPTDPQNATDELNPAGLVYKLSYTENECVDPAPTMLYVHVYKYLANGESMSQVADDAGVAPFPMTATWMTSNLNGGVSSSAGYVLGNNHGGAYLKYSASTSPMQAPADYTTSEVTGGNILPVGAQCEAGKYRLVGYKSGSSLAAAQMALPTPIAPVFTDIISDRFVIVVNELCAQQAPTHVKVTIAKYIDGVHATAGNAAGASFSMTATYNFMNEAYPNPTISAGEVYSIGPVGNNTANEYEAQTLSFYPGANYGTFENIGGNVGSSCDVQNPPTYALMGYSYGDSLAAAQAMAPVMTAPSYTNLQSDKFVIVHNKKCGQVQGNTSVRVYIYKYLKVGEAAPTQIMSGSGAPSFPMTATWNATNASGSGTYGLENGNGYTAVTSALDAPTDYTTSEVTDGSPVLAIGAECEANKYRLVGYKSGTSLANAQAAAVSATAPVYTDIAADQHVIVVNEDCDDVIGGGGIPNGTLIIKKKTTSGNGTFTIQVDGTCPIVDVFEVIPDFGCMIADALTLPTNVVLTTVDGIDTESIQLPPGNYDVTEIVPEGWDLVNSYCNYEGESEGIAIQNGENVTITSNDTVTCTFKNSPEIGQGTQTIVVTGNTSAGENLLGWMFNRDTTTQSPFAFNTYFASIGTGSLYVQPITNTVNGNSDKFVGELFLQTPISTLNSISYDFMIATSGIAADKDHFYMNVYANFGESSPTKFYDCRYNVVPTVGIVNGTTTVTFDPNLTYSVTTRGGATPSPYTCPASPSAMQAMSIGTSSIRAIAISVGDTSGSDTGVSGAYDKVVVNTDSMITTYDFEPVPAVPPTNGGGDGSPQPQSFGGGNGMPVGGFSAGSVLGASASLPELPAGCDALLHTYMRIGKPNNAAEVKLLQKFLNDNVGTNLPISGVFGPLTHNAVKKFQQQHAAEVLNPWGLTSPTGFVYLTTQRWINLIHCSTLNIPMPALIPASDL